jgi:hypothetical protein
MSRPAPASRAVTGVLVSVAAAGGVCWWALRGVDRRAIAEAVRGADVGVLAALTAGYLGVFYAVEIAGFLTAYRRHLVPDVPARHVAVVVGGKQLLGVVSPLLTKVVAPVYFHRRWDVPVLSAVGASELVGFADGVATVLLVTGAVAIGAGLPGPLVASFVGWWVVLAVYVVWAWAPHRPDRRSKLRDTKLLRPLASTTPRELAAQVVLRLALGLASAAVAAGVLAELGPGQGPGGQLSAGQLALLGALLFTTAMLPLSVAGYGGPQGVAILLLVEAWGVASREEALAFSLVWSTMFLAGRVVVGTALAAPLLRLLDGA